MDASFPSVLNCYLQFFLLKSKEQTNQKPLSVKRTGAEHIRLTVNRTDGDVALMLTLSPMPSTNCGPRRQAGWLSESLSEWPHNWSDRRIRHVAPEHGLWQLTTAELPNGRSQSWSVWRTGTRSLLGQRRRNRWVSDSESGCLLIRRQRMEDEEVETSTCPTCSNESLLLLLILL